MKINLVQYKHTLNIHKGLIIYINFGFGMLGHIVIDNSNLKE